MSEGHKSPTVEQMNQSTEVFNYYSCLNGILLGMFTRGQQAMNN